MLPDPLPEDFALPEPDGQVARCTLRRCADCRGALTRALRETKLRVNAEEEAKQLALENHRLRERLAKLEGTPRPKRAVPQSKDRCPRCGRKPEPPEGMKWRGAAGRYCECPPRYDLDGGRRALPY